MDSRETSSVGPIEIVPRTESLASDDDRWLTQVAAFYEELRDAGVPIRQEGSPVPGAKGEIEAIILALGTAGAFTAAVTALREFLSRERTRSFLVRWTERGKRREVVVKGDADSATIERIIRQAMRQSSRT